MAIVVALIVTTVAVPRSASAHEDDVYEFTGSGWGHSIGLSQYGAYGQALEGATYNEILAYYYRDVSITTVESLVAGTEIAPDHPIVADSTPIWVGIRQSETVVSLSPVDGPFGVCQEIDGAQTCVDVGWSGENVAEVWEIAQVELGTETGCLIERIDPPVVEGEVPILGFGSCAIDITWGDVGQASRVTLDGDLCGDPSSGLGRECFFRGSLHLRSDGVASGFHVMAELGIEEYLYGLGEMPSSWPEEALRAQALAGRSYVIRRVLTHENPELATSSDPGLTDTRRATCWCHLHSTSLDQNYTGYAKEAEATGETVWGERWVAAVDATAGEVIVHPDAVPSTIVLALYHSSSGGHTESNEAVWGTTGLVYLEPVADPWSNDEAVSNPFAEWTISMSAADLAGALGWGEVTHLTMTSGAPDARFEIRGILAGEEITEARSGGWMYSTLGSRSPHFNAVTVDRFEPFLDMGGSVHTEAILAVWEAEITFGCGDDFYCPDDPVTRAQMASFMARALGLGLVDDGPFSDISDAGVHVGAINAIAVAGVTSGCAVGQYCPDDPVTRAQMASFMARALGLGLVDDGPFSDISDAGVHIGAINAIAAVGVTSGCGDGLYCPDDLVNRAQMASFLARAFVWVDESNASSSEQEAVSPT